MTSSTVAILVDGDNISSQYAGQILRKTRDLGATAFRLAFCNHQSLGDWSSAQSFRSVHTGSGKNGSDIVLSIYAMEYALRDNIHSFAIVSSDGDLCHIAHRLRELGRHVVGLGEEKAPKTFKYACTEFHLLSPPAAKVDDAALSDMDQIVRTVLREADPHRHGVLVGRLNGLVRARDKSIMISQHEDKNWPSYLAARDRLYTVTGAGAQRLVRIAAQQDDT